MVRHRFVKHAQTRWQCKFRKLPPTNQVYTNFYSILTLILHGPAVRVVRCEKAIRPQLLLVSTM